MSISWTMPSITVWSAGPPMEVRLAVAVSYESDERGALGRDQELVPVGGLTVAGVDRGDLLAVGVVDVVGPVGQPAEAGALPPGQHGAGRGRSGS